MPFDLKAVNKPLAGKPVWVWGVVGGVAVLGVYYWNSSHRAAVAAAGTATTQGGAPDNATIDAYPTTSNGSFTYGAPVDYSGSSVVADAGNTLGSSNLDTNASWVAKGVLITGGGTVAKDALNAFLAGKPLTPQQAAYVTTTKTLLGNAPQSPSLAIQLISNAVPVAKKTNTVAKVNTAAKTVIVPKPKAKPKVKAKVKAKVTPTIPRDTANRAAQQQAAARNAAAGSPTGSLIGNTGEFIGQGYTAAYDVATGNYGGAVDQLGQSIGTAGKGLFNLVTGKWF